MKVALPLAALLLASLLVPTASAASVAGPLPAATGVRSVPLAVPSPLGPLRGALTLPAGHGPFPAVVLVAGSGPNDLDETIGPNKPFRDLANGLAGAGIASLRYDKRTLDYGLQMAAKPHYTIDDEVTDDALAAVHLLARQRGIDPHRVFVLGHSLGGQLAPRIAQRDPGIAGLIMLAAPARPLLDVLAQQFRTLGRAQGASAQQIAALEEGVEQERKVLDAADARHPPQGMSTVIPAAPVPQIYLYSLHAYDQLATARALTLPLLILQGGNDFQVSPTLDFDAWKSALAGRANATFRLYPGLSHLFMPGPTQAPADYAQPAHVDPRVIVDIADWIKAQPAR